MCTGREKFSYAPYRAATEDTKIIARPEASALHLHSKVNACTGERLSDRFEPNRGLPGCDGILSSVVRPLLTLPQWTDILKKIRETVRRERLSVDMQIEVQLYSFLQLCHNVAIRRLHESLLALQRSLRINGKAGLWTAS